MRSGAESRRMRCPLSPLPPPSPSPSPPTTRGSLAGPVRMDAHADSPAGRKSLGSRVRGESLEQRSRVWDVQRYFFERGGDARESLGELRAADGARRAEVPEQLRDSSRTSRISPPRWPSSARVSRVRGGKTARATPPIDGEASLASRLLTYSRKRWSISRRAAAGVAPRVRPTRPRRSSPPGARTDPRALSATRRGASSRPEASTHSSRKSLR